MIKARDNMIRPGYKVDGINLAEKREKKTHQCISLRGVVFLQMHSLPSQRRIALPLESCLRVEQNIKPIRPSIKADGNRGKLIKNIHVPIENFISILHLDFF